MGVGAAFTHCNMDIPARSFLKSTRQTLRDITALVRMQEVDTFLFPIRALVAGEPGARYKAVD